MTYEQINFNEQWAATKTEKEFLEEAEINQWFANDKNKISKLKEVHKLCKKLVSKSTTNAAEK